MNARKNALGRGLGALIEDNEPRPFKGDNSLFEVEIDKVLTNPFQPRTNFEEDAMQELANSIRELGIIQPITVRKTENGTYQLITGERRLRAAKIAGLTSIPAFVRTADDQGMLEMALVENIQREDLDSIEVAISYQRLIEECSLTQENLSDRVGKKRSTISNYLRLLKLPAEIQLGLRQKKLSMGHARTLINIEDAGAQLAIFHQIIDNDLSVRQVEDMVRKLNQPPQDDPRDKSFSRPATDAEYNALRDHLRKYFGTKVEFTRNPAGKGKIVIPFDSNEDLDRIIGVMDKLNS
jgi:ParB family transcriptional regulator, chromosome partitioning protein